MSLKRSSITDLTGIKRLSSDYVSRLRQFLLSDYYATSFKVRGTVAGAISPIVPVIMVNVIELCGKIRSLVTRDLQLNYHYHLI